MKSAALFGLALMLGATAISARADEPKTVTLTEAELAAVVDAAAARALAQDREQRASDALRKLRAAFEPPKPQGTPPQREEGKQE